MKQIPNSTTSISFDDPLINDETDFIDTAQSDSDISLNEASRNLATYSETYFDALYSDNTDPWHYQTRWYEKRKRDICLAVLPQAQYNNAIELGCGNGVFSELLGSRCQKLISIDGNNQAIQLAKQRLVGSPHIVLIQGVIPNVLLNLKFVDDAPTNKLAFDLIVISEILYYLSPDDIDTVITWIKQNLAIGGTLLCCHWRYSIDGFAMTGELVHQRLQQAFNSTNKANQQAFNHQSKVVDTDFLLDIWQHTTNSVAKQENLV